LLPFLRHNQCNRYFVRSMFRLHSIALPVCTQLRPSVFLPLITIWACSWTFADVPPLPHHTLDAGTDPHVLFTFDWLMKCIVSLIMHQSSSLPEASTIRRCFSLDFVSRASCILSWLICQRISYLQTQRSLRSSYLDLTILDRATLRRLFLLDSPHP
jgi:hypothetical protein